MEAKAEYFPQDPAPVTETVRTKSAAANCAVASPRQGKCPRAASQGRRRPVASKRRVGKEAVKAGMATSLGVAMLTGLKILKPMSLHGPASWIFVGLTLVHTLVYELPNRSSRQ